MKLKSVLAICGSTRSDSSNLQILKAIKKKFADKLNIEIFSSIASLPHFNPDHDIDENVPLPVKEFRQLIASSDGVIICTPEYVFSLPGSLKNAIEWTVSTIIFSEKPVALITASGLGSKAHEALMLIMKTIYAKFNEQTQLLISGARSKVDRAGNIVDEKTIESINELMENFILLL